VATVEYLESWKTAWFFRAVGMIPLKRVGGSTSERALAAAREVLNRGGLLGVYPEGTRSPDGRLYQGHSGAARLAAQCGPPIIPVAQLGTERVQPIGARWPRPFRHVDITIGDPIWWSGGTGGTRQLRHLTDQVLAAIASLSGQELAGEYATRDRGRLSAPGSEAHPVSAQT
jgi:1-acyl-sn-glycerol-3-phosphate acyltransferase